MRCLEVLTLRSLAGPFLGSLGVLVLFGLTLEAATLVLRTPILPEPSVLLLATLLLSPSLLLSLLPMALLLGWLVLLRRWEEDGTWTGLAAAGLRGRRLIPSALASGLLVALGMAWMAHALAPAARRASGSLLAESSSPSHLLPGRVLQSSSFTMLRSPAGWVFFESARDSLSGIASGAELLPSSEGWRVEMADGRVFLEEEGTSGEVDRLSFRRASLPLDARPQARRLELDEREDRELLRLARRRESVGVSGAYERNILHKRSTHPIGTLLLPLLALPLGLGRRGRPVVGLVIVLTWWTLVRIGDRLCFTLGAPLASLFPVLGVLLGSALLWGRWRER